MSQVQPKRSLPGNLVAGLSLLVLVGAAFLVTAAYKPHWLPTSLSSITAPYEYGKLKKFSVLRELPENADDVQRQLERAETQLKLAIMDIRNAEFTKEKFEEASVDDALEKASLKADYSATLRRALRANSEASDKLIAARKDFISLAEQTVLVETLASPSAIEYLSTEPQFQSVKHDLKSFEVIITELQEQIGANRETLEQALKRGL